MEYEALLPAVKQGLLAEADIDQALRRLLTARFRLGMFDPPAMVKYAQIPLQRQRQPRASPARARSRAQIHRAAEERKSRALPLSKSLKTIAVIGPDADDLDALTGNYNGDPTAPITPLEGIRHKLPNARVIYAPRQRPRRQHAQLRSRPASALFTSNAADQPRRTHRRVLSTPPTSMAKRTARANSPIPTPAKWSAMSRAIPSRSSPASIPKSISTGATARPRPDMNDDDFGVRWTGYLAAPVTGTYQLGAIGMNAFELYLDGKRIVELQQHPRAFLPL